MEGGAVAAALADLRRQQKNWKMIAKTAFPDSSRSDIQCLHRWKKVLKPGLVKGPWKDHEDKAVADAVLKTGIKKVKWSAVAQLVEGRLGKQVRENIWGCPRGG